jgi:hypothetical protein
MFEDRQGPHFLSVLLTGKPRLVQRGFSFVDLTLSLSSGWGAGRKPGKIPIQLIRAYGQQEQLVLDHIHVANDQIAKLPVVQ